MERFKGHQRMRFLPHTWNPKLPRIMAQYSKIGGIASKQSIMFGILEVQAVLLSICLGIAIAAALNKRVFEPKSSVRCLVPPFAILLG